MTSSRKLRPTHFSHNRHEFEPTPPRQGDEVITAIAGLKDDIDLTVVTAKVVGEFDPPSPSPSPYATHPGPHVRVLLAC